MVNISRSTCELVIAGPGTGKTHGMIEEISSRLSELSPARIIAVITYTNAASEEIQTRLQRRSQLPPNLFVGTTHSFLNRFLLLPYSKLFGFLPAETIFIDSVNLPYKAKNKYIEKNAKIKKSDNFLKRGIVVHDKTVEISNRLIQNSRIVELLANRLQMVFVDEYQDATLLQHEIFEAVLDKGKTTFYFVGDPEQYIFSFRYGGSLIKNENKPIAFNEIPFLKLKAKADRVQVTYKGENKRSNPNIVEFLNNFNTQTHQSSSNDQRQSYNVKFIDKQEIGQIIESFNKICEPLLAGDRGFKKFYLSHFNKTLQPFAPQYGLSPISNENAMKKNKLMSECLSYISGIFGRSQKEIREIKKINQIALRKIGLKMLKRLKENSEISHENMSAFISGELSLELDKETNCANAFERLRHMYSCDGKTCVNQYSTIHKAKGLEADAVLVISETENKLRKWLEKEQKKRFADKTDDCRVGFVGFSRAKEILCIACCKDIGNSRKILQDLSVEII